MSAITRFYYLNKNTFSSSEDIENMFLTESGSGNKDNKVQIIKKNDNDETDYDDSELLPYTPSSADRSSVSSIPWADDAIKKNQIDWDHIESLLSGREQAKPEETDLAQEVQEWQEKFPKVFGNKTFKVQDMANTNHFDDEIDTLSNASLDFSDAELADGYITPTQQYFKETTNVSSLAPKQSIHDLQMDNRHRQNSVADLALLLSRNLRISSVPLTWRARQSYTERTDVEESEVSASRPKIPPRPPPRRLSPTFNPLIIAPADLKYETTQKLNEKLETRNRIPSIFNVLETKRRFRGLGNNRSFVQLTQLQQARSALPQQSTRQTTNVQTAWHVPLAATTVGGRFLNNRNAIILPALNLRRSIEQASYSASSNSSHSPSVLNSVPEYGHFEPAFYLQPQHSNRFSSVTPSTSGRSISAAVHHPRKQLSAFYVPYSAANKFKSFNKI